MSGMVCFCAHRAESRDFAMLGQVPKWTKGADCKSVAIGFQGSNPCLPTIPSLLEPLASINCERRFNASSDLVVYSRAERRELSAETLWLGTALMLSAEYSELATDKMCGRSSVVEFQPSKLAVRGSNPLARSISRRYVRRYSLNVKEGGQGMLGLENNESRLTKQAHVAQLVEHVLGKDEVTRSIRVVGSSVNGI